MVQAKQEQMATNGAQQLIFDLDHRPALEREDFLIAPCNEDAVAVVDRWPDWPSPIIALAGPPGAGKTHLAQVWRQKSGAILVDGDGLADRPVPDLLANGALVIDGGEKVSCEEDLLHLINLANQENVFLLLISCEPPGRWQIGLADLRSRLQTIPTITLGRPCDTLLKGVLAKLFDDRQLDVSSDISDYLIARMERSLDAVRRIVTLIDHESMAQKRKVSRKLVSELLTKRAQDI